MATFFIIDKARNLFVQQADSKTSAMELYNNRHYHSPCMHADLAIEATPCKHVGKFLRPILPEWMEYHTDHSTPICLSCTAQVKPTEVAPIETQELFVHDKKYF